MITKKIHFGGKDVLLELTKNKESLVTTIDGKQLSIAPFPEIYIDNKSMSDFWDLLREEIVQISYGKRGDKVSCLLRKEVQKSLEV